MLECEKNETAVGVQHLSLFGTDESEVLSSLKYEVSIFSRGFRRF